MLVIWNLKECKNEIWVMEYNIEVIPLNYYNIVHGCIHADADDDDDGLAEVVRIF